MFLRLPGLFLIAFLCAVVVLSQDKDVEDDEPPPPPRAQSTPVGVGYGIGNGIGVGIRNRDDEKTGSIIRGRAFYEDTGKPVRRGWIGFIKIRELIEKKAADQTGETLVINGDRSDNAERYVLTNDQGEFVIRGFKAGIYIPTLKVKGVLNPDVSDRQNPLFQQIPVDGVNEVQVTVGVKRGGAISGRILYPDGEPVIGAKVQIFKKRERMTDSSPSYTGSDSLTVAVTDDRGFYRFAGLPAEEYFVRVVEPSVHSESEKSVLSYEMAQFDSGSELKTFYPSVSTIKEAKSIAVVLGQEQGDVDIHIPDRRLFRISGTAVAKNSKNPLKGLKVRFEKVVEGQIVYNIYDRSKQTGTNEEGVWAFKDLPKGKYRITVSMDDSYTDYYPSSETQSPKKESAPKYAPLSKEF